MAYNASLNTVYNHYLQTYSSMRPSRYDAHKKSELRSIYNSIVKINKESPLFMVDRSKASQEFAIGLKENARQLRNTIASLGGLHESELLNKKVADSSHPDVVTATFVGSLDEDIENTSFDISVKNLATEQVNQGAFLSADAKIDLPPDSYSFDVSVDDLNYEFQFNIHEGETNKDIQSRLARLFSTSEINLKAQVLYDENGNSALMLASKATGITPPKENLFFISDDNTSKKAGAVSYLGLNHTVQNPSNAEFYIDGERHTALANRFTINKTFELELKRVSTEDVPVHIGLKTDTESINENIVTLIDGYNSFLQGSSDYLETHPKSSRYIQEMKGAARLYNDGMAALGLQMQSSGEILIEDESKLSRAYSDQYPDSLSAMKGFTNAILRKTNQIALNPMDYVDKKIVAYKNPGRNHATPYITSAYSGLMFNSYC